MDTIFNLTMRLEISDLSKDVLGNDGMAEVDALVSDLLSHDTHDHAVQILQQKIGMCPKRPLYYLNHEICYLPEETRDVIRYAGDYIDQLYKHFTHEKGRGVFTGLRAYGRSLGINLSSTNKILDSRLHDILTRYNKHVYTPAKHHWDVGNRPHLFSAKEAVAICLMTVKLSEEIIALSDEAKAYSENRVHEYYDSK
ncbi:MAG: hypothetical protein WC769_06555 [Thermodesulfovibrionales bacterium]|jgi:hypothetical protein